MFRILSRLISLFALAFAVIYVVIDASRSIAASALVFTPLERTLFQVIPLQAEQFIGWASDKLPPVISDTILATALQLPTCVVAGVLALIFYALSRKTKRRIGRFSLD